MINRAIRGGYSWELLVDCIVLFAKSLLQILYQLRTNTYKANLREYSPVTSVLCILVFKPFTVLCYVN